MIRTSIVAGNILRIGLNNGPVNAMSPGLLQGIAKACQSAELDETVRGVLIASDCRAFSAGLDLKVCSLAESAESCLRAPNTLGFAARQGLGDRLRRNQG